MSYIRLSCGSFPGFLCPGLIEALAQAVQRPLLFCFPGFLCPGLIEAITRSPVGSTGPSCFPGFLCPGLIEATRITVQPQELLVVFRGFYAPASLKPPE